MPTWNQIQQQLRNPNNPVVFFDITVGQAEIGRMIMELFADVCPRTAENFRQFCTGEFKKDNVPVGVMALAHCVYIIGPSFSKDENFVLKHSGPGLLSMANSGKDTNGCQFFITCSKCDFLDNKHVVFGRVIDGLLVMRKIENVPTGPNNKPKIPVIISQCGQM
ncbi:Peptidyl-prolyl cis-trans isomerase 11 [Armadillidium nasatum]|uniref:Peptidyl-prolyl cis-trans isomerase n=1 Tax=Armadillidium nasatum TaxID=96803 RepID=A0A5N5TKA6_9CRUS|nr:Peptidyl-prolyl cis-trans isomerase 11 [Armadillidium nasatum]